MFFYYMIRWKVQLIMALITIQFRRKVKVLYNDLIYGLDNNAIYKKIQDSL